jgi:hypothetical protein
MCVYIKVRAFASRSYIVVARRLSIVDAAAIGKNRVVQGSRILQGSSIRGSIHFDKHGLQMSSCH